MGFYPPLPQKNGVGKNSRHRGLDAEQQALEHLQSHGLILVERNFKTPGRGGGEIDLIMRDARPGQQNTLVFVEVRMRRRSREGDVHGTFGGALGSITATKRQRIQFAAQCFLQRYAQPSPCRFDVIALDGSQLEWIAAAFSMDD